jgi:hypothetical protein
MKVLATAAPKSVPPPVTIATLPLSEPDVLFNEDDPELIFLLQFNLLCRP